MASSKRSIARGTPSRTISRARPTTSTSSRTKSTSNRRAVSTVAIALGSNLGDRRLHLARALHALQDCVRIVRVSAIRETEPVGAPAGSPLFLNMAIVGYTALEPEELLAELLAIEQRLGRVRRGLRNAPRVIDLDLIVYSARRMRTKSLTLPHPRAGERAFVMEPLREISAFSAFPSSFPSRR